MAVTTVTPVKLGLNTFEEALTFTQASSATDGYVVPFTDTDTKTLFLFQNTATTSQTVTIKKGNGIQGVADLTSGEIAASGVAAITVDSGRFKHVSGDLKGKIQIIPSDVKVKMAVIVLP